MDEMLKELSRIVNSLKERRYPVLLITEKVDRDKLVALAENIDATYIDYLDDVMLSEDGPIPGAYQRWRLCEWLKEKAKSLGTLIVDEVEPIISTWDDRDKKAFYKEFLKTESKSPIILVSPIGRNFQSKSYERGKGIVWESEF